MTGRPRSVLVLGSTGSIGTQALDVVSRNPELFRIAGIAASGSAPVKLARQALEHRVKALAVVDEDAVEDVRLALRAQATRAPGTAVPTILAGPDAVFDLIDRVRVDVVLNGMPGSQGLEPTLRALATGASVALANKESLVAGGPLVLEAAAPGQLVPVDSEHSALAQALWAGAPHEVGHLVLTASGGPFRGRTRAELADVTLEQALAHPTWSMGPVVSVNSATLMNKGLELIEAQLLFGIPADRIEVVVHPQSVVHSMVTFADGSTIAQASPPDMRLPIALAMNWPNRVPDAVPPCRWDLPRSWQFEPLDVTTIPAVDLARQAAASGGCLPAVYNAANEQAVAAFLGGRTSFLSIVDTVGVVVEAADAWADQPRDVADVLAAERWARAHCAEALNHVNQLL